MLRPATLADAPALAALAREAFSAAFAPLYALADLAAFFAAWKTPEHFRTIIADPVQRVCVSDDGGRIVAYCVIALGKGFDERPAPRPARPVTLSQIYTDPRATGQGLGAALMEWALAAARAWQADAVQLSVFSENLGAQRFYRRRGFRHVADIDFWVGNHLDHEFLYELPL